MYKFQTWRFLPFLSAHRILKPSFGDTPAGVRIWRSAYSSPPLFFLCFLFSVREIAFCNDTFLTGPIPFASATPNSFLFSVSPCSFFFSRCLPQEQDSSRVRRFVPQVDHPPRLCASGVSPPRNIWSSTGFNWRFRLLIFLTGP